MDDRRGGGYDHERGSVAPDDGSWRRSAHQRVGGGGYDRDMGRGGYDDRRGPGGMGRDSGYGDPPASSAERPRLQLQSRTAPPPLPPMASKETPTAPPASAPPAKPSGPRSNPFGAAQAVDTTQRDKEIEAKAESARLSALRRRDEAVRSGVPPAKASNSGDVDRPAGGTANGGAQAQSTDNGTDVTNGVSTNANEKGQEVAPGDDAKVDDDRSSPNAPGNSLEEARVEGKDRTRDAPPAKPVGRWASLRREREAADDRYGPGGGAYSRRDRDDDRRGPGMGGPMDSRRRDDRPFGRRDDSSYGSRMDRDPVAPPAPPAGNAFAKRFGSNFDRDADRSYSRTGGMGMGGYDRRDDDRRGGMGGGYDRRDDDRRGGMGGGYDRREDDRRGGMGMGYDRRDDDRRGYGGAGGYERRDEGRMGGPKFVRDDRNDGYPRRPDEAPLDRAAPSVRESLGARTGGSPTAVSPPSSLSKMSIKDEVKDPKPAPTSAAGSSAIKKPEPEPEPEPEQEQEPEQVVKEDPVEVARDSAAEALGTGKRGQELKDFVMAQEKRTTAGALLEAALENIATPQDMNWAGTDEFGAALTALSADNTEEQVGIIYAVVAKCHKLGFPKDEKGAIVQTIFMGMYNNDLCEEDAFMEWKVSFLLGFLTSAPMSLVGDSREYRDAKFTAPHPYLDLPERCGGFSAFWRRSSMPQYHVSPSKNACPVPSSWHVSRDLFEAMGHYFVCSGTCHLVGLPCTEHALSPS